MNLARNYLVHNLIGHPLMGLFELVGWELIADTVHDLTLPPEDEERIVRGHVTEYGGGYMRIMVDRDTPRYLIGRVEVHKR